MLEDHVLVSKVNGAAQLIAIEVAREADSPYTPVNKPISEELLDKFFVYDAEKRAYYVRKKKNSDGTLSSRFCDTTPMRVH